MEEVTPSWIKHTTRIIGVILTMIGVPLTINLLCIAPFIVFSGGFDYQPSAYGTFSLTLVALTLGIGIAAILHANLSLKGKPSRRLRLPPILVLVGVFGLLVVFGLVLASGNILPGFFFPPILLIAGALPPLWAVAWFMPRTLQQDEPKAPAEKGFTWRRGLLSFSGGASLGVLIAILLEIILPAIILTLVFNLAGSVRDSLEALFDALAGSNVARALNSPGFLIVFVQIAVIAPLAEEIAKPLVTLPLLKRVNKQEAFWLGAMAGAGFAALENTIYAASGYPIWAGILLVRALGGALHPLCSGLTTLGWHAVLHGEKNSGSKWMLRFGSAVALHAAWNGGSLLVITLGGASFFGKLPPEIDILGLSAVGITLAFLVVLGLAALWIGRLYGHGKAMPDILQAEPSDAAITPSDRAVALWALACLAAIVPAGIAGLRLWLH